jgi:hypothetical protein
MFSLKILLAIFFLVQSVATFADNQSADTQSDKSEKDANTAIELGKRIYREGILSSGEPMRGFVQGDIPITGTHLACVNCHRRSGFGSIEGNVTTPQITGDILYAPVTSRASEFYQLRKPDEKTRPAYNDDLLASAIREGRNPAGRRFDKLMPLYTLSPKDMEYLLSYLKTLKSDNSPGVTKTDLHLATIMVEDVPQSEKRAMLRVLYQFIETLNTDTRPRTRRAEHAPWHKKWHYESHRTWKLHVWQLEGPENTWREQLELLYARDPVFAVVSGIGDDNWRPVHIFCEKNEIPCLLPNINAPVVSKDDYYSVYFSQGLTLEAKVLAKHLVNSSKADENEKKALKKIYQVFSNKTSGSIPAATLRKALSGRKTFDVVDLDPSEIGEIKGDGTVVFWMNKNELLGLDLDKVDFGEARIFLSASMVDVNEASSELKNRLKQEPYFVYPYSKPEDMKRKLKASIRWMESRKIPVVDEQLQANTLYAATLLSRVLKHMGSNFSRDYLIERIEHLDKNVVVSPVYPKLTLGPEQRYASTGAYVVKTNANNSIDIISDWIIP